MKETITINVHIWFKWIAFVFFLANGACFFIMDCSWLYIPYLVSLWFAKKIGIIEKIEKKD
jgi:hypothetical protein